MLFRSKRNSTPSNPAAAAAANLSKKSNSLNIIEMFAANFGMVIISPILLVKSCDNFVYANSINIKGLILGKNLSIFGRKIWPQFLVA